MNPLSTRVNIDAGWILLQAHRFDEAIKQARRAQELEPGLAEANACIARSLFYQKKYREAIDQFDSVVAKYPRSEKVPGALLKKGYAYSALGDNARAIVQFQYVVHEYPKAQEAPLAKQKLKALGVDIR